MQSELVTTDTSFAALRDDWNRLAGDDPLATWEWRSTWWKHYGRRRSLAISVVRRDDGRVVGIAPCYTEHSTLQGRKLSWLGSGKVCTDYQRFLVEPSVSVVERAKIIDELTEALYDARPRNAPQDIWDLDGVEPESPATIELEQSLRRRGFVVHVERLDSSWVMDLPSDWSTFVAGCHRAIRRKINKAQRRANDPDIQYFTATTPAEIAAFWPEFVRLHSARFSTKVCDGGCFADPLFAMFLPEVLQQLSERGLVRLIWCAAAGKPISSQLYLLGARTVYMYQSGFDPAYAHLEPGYLLYTRSFHDLIDAGYTKFDFLRGDESYKSGWNTQGLPLVRVLGIPPRRTSQLRHQTYLLARSVKRVAKQTWSNRATDAAPTTNDSDSEPAVKS